MIPRFLLFPLSHVEEFSVFAIEDDRHISVAFADRFLVNEELGQAIQHRWRSIGF